MNHAVALRYVGPHPARRVDLGGRVSLLMDVSSEMIHKRTNPITGANLRLPGCGYWRRGIGAVFTLAL